MANVSRPLIALLVATVAFFALWVVALKPGSRTTGGTASQPSLNSYQQDINAAKNVQKVVNGNTSRQGAAESGQSGTTPAASTPAGATSAPATAAKPVHHARPTIAHHTAAPRAAHHSRASHHARATHQVANPGVAPTPAARLSSVDRALVKRDALALLFYNPGAPDDQAVKQELGTIPTHRGQVFKLAIPVSELPSYAALTSQVPVNFTPTLVVVNRQHDAFQLTGFADTYAITQLVNSAL